MNRVEFKGVALDPLSRVELSLETGVHAILGALADGSVEFMDLAAGLRAPRRGNVLLNGKRIFGTPELRRRIGCLRAEEHIRGPDLVRDYVSIALEIRNDAQSPEQIFSRAGLSHWLSRKTSTLMPLESRTVMLLLALFHPSTLVLSLHQPLQTVLGKSPLIYETIHAARQKGAVVIASVLHPSEAALLAGTVYKLERGVFKEWRAPASSVNLTRVKYVLFTPSARAFLGHLAQEPDISGVEWAGSHENTLLVAAPNAEKLCRTVVRVALQYGLRVEGWHPELQDTRAATVPGSQFSNPQLKLTELKSNSAMFGSPRPNAGIPNESQFPERGGS